MTVGHFFVDVKICANASFPCRLNSYSYGIQLVINCTALDQSKLSNFVECTIITKILETQLSAVLFTILCM